MNPNELYQTLSAELKGIEEAKTFKYEVPLESIQGGTVRVAGRDAVMLASNNYLGLANHPKIVEAAHRGLDEWGYGMASVRFLCGTEPIHLELEKRIAGLLGCDATILHSSFFAANEAFFTALLAAAGIARPDDWRERVAVGADRKQSRTARENLKLPEGLEFPAALPEAQQQLVEFHAPGLRALLGYA